MLAHRYTPGGPNYYSPYPLLTDLRGESTLWERVQAANGLTLEERARAVGYAIPKPPLAWKTFQGLWRAMVNVDIMALELGRAYTALAWQLGQGAVDCDELNLYNQAALRHYEVQSKLAQLLRMDPTNVVPGTVPFPALFIGRGQMGGKVGELLCTPGQHITRDQVTPQSGCPGMIPPDVPGSGISAAPVVLYAIGAAAVVAIGWVITRNEVEMAQIEALSRGAEKGAAYSAARNEAVVLLAKRCMEADPTKDPTKCMDAAAKALGDPGKVFRDAAKQISNVGGLPWYAWVGIGLGVLAVGGSAALYLANRK